MKLEIFKVGKHTSSNGITKNYTLNDLNQIISNHSEPIPIVVGHPKDNSPAFGWIKNLFVKGESLFAEATDIVPEFLDLIKQKIYKNRSVSLRTNSDGELFLNHVAFLGGVLPAVKGLEELNLSSDESESFEMDFSEVELEAAENISHLPVKKKKNTSKKETTNFAEEIANLKSLVTNLSTQFNEAIQTMQGTVDSTDIKSKIDELNLRLDSANFQRTISEKMQMDNLTPAIKNKILNLLSYFESLDFSEEQNIKVISEFQELAELIEPFQTEEVLKKVESEKNTKSSNEFSEMNVDKDSLKLFNEASAYAKEFEISFQEAVNILINKNEEV